MKNKTKINEEINLDDCVNVNSVPKNDPAVSSSERTSKFVNSNSSVSLLDRLRKLLMFFTVEPFLLCYFIPGTMFTAALQKLNLEKACRVDLNYTERVCESIIYGYTNDNITDETKSAPSNFVSNTITWQGPLQSSVSTIIVLFVGAWSDRTGNRKALMLVPIFGEMISSFGLILTTYYFLEWPLWVTALIEALPTALSGGLSIALMGTYSFLADITTPESRTFRIGLVAIIVTLGIPFGTSISGVLTESVGYYGVFGIGFALYVIGFIYTFFRVHNIRNDKEDGTFVSKIISFFHPRNVWDTISILFVTPTRQKIQIVLVIFVHIVIMGPVVGESSVLNLYTLDRYAMNHVDLSFFSTYSTLMGTAGMTVAITVFSKFLKMHDAFLGIIATACKVASSFTYALAPTRNWFYAGPVFDFLGNSGVTAIRSLGTKVVDADKVGKMCSLLGLAESLIPIVYIPLYSQTYTLTNKTTPGAVYFLGAAMTIPAFFIFIILYVMSKREQSNDVKDPVAKEVHAYDNDVTVL